MQVKCRSATARTARHMQIPTDTHVIRARSSARLAAAVSSRPLDELSKALQKYATIQLTSLTDQVICHILLRCTSETDTQGACVQNTTQAGGRLDTFLPRHPHMASRERANETLNNFWRSTILTRNNITVIRSPSPWQTRTCGARPPTD